MKYYTFKNEANDFEDILNDISIKSAIKLKIKWTNHLILGFTENAKNENIFGYIVLKYGDYIFNPIKDYTPIPNVDYKPKRN